MNSMLEVSSVSIAFGGVKAVRDVSISVPAGTVFSIIGPNGAGKTTLFNMISGVYSPQGGSIRLNGKDVTGMRSDALAREGLSRTFQNLQVFMHMSAVENVMVGRHMHECSRTFSQLFSLPGALRENRASQGRSRELLQFVGLGCYADRSAAAMPYGALKKLELARALATEPKMILLDEPAAGCNPAETIEVEKLVRKIASSGVTVLLVEHDMKLVMRISDRIHVLDGGQTICEGTASEVQRNERVIAAYLGDHGRREAANA
ncbi:branched-chain amino acid transport system ATP-binding protein [Bradyrhizobium sp. AZCC 1577]|uniref:ABC transporter ATP-binding protein n=1 Tax=Bradyrhizobium sp. AZCC 1577 TaxID=3117019 RepID=UPI002FEE74E2